MAPGPLDLPPSPPLSNLPAPPSADPSRPTAKEDAPASARASPTPPASLPPAEVVAGAEAAGRPLSLRYLSPCGQRVKYSSERVRFMQH